MHRRLLFELMTGMWLMDVRYLHQIRMNLETDLSSVKEDREPIALSFYDEDINPVHSSHSEEISEGSIAVLHIIGAMTKYGDWWTQGASEVIAQLDFANSHPNVSAIVVVIDGPGGSASAISPFIDFSLRKQKPIVALADTALSLHYWIANAIADHIMADNVISARFGSVGVVSSWMDFSEHYEKAGIKPLEIYSDLSNHKNEIFRLMKEDQEKGEQLLKNRELNSMAKQFQEAVKASRKNLQEAEGVLTGRTFSAKEALKLGMIDGIGNLTEALNIALVLSEAQSINRTF